MQILTIVASQKYDHSAKHATAPRGGKRGKLTTRPPPEVSIEDVAAAHKRNDVRLVLVAARKVKELLTDVEDGPPSREIVVRCVDALAVRLCPRQLRQCLIRLRCDLFRAL